MRNIFGALLLAFLCVSAVGCGPARTLAEINELDYGPYPENYQEIVIEHMSRRFADPYSARYEFQGPPTFKYKPPLLLGLGEEVWGWGGIVYVNAKNMYGAYTGPLAYDYIIRDGRVIW